MTTATEIRFYRAAGPYGFLSNLYRREVTFEGRVFRSAEDAYQFGKPSDPAVAEWLVSAPKPHLCAAAAHALFVFDVRPDWNRIKVDRMRAVLAAKFGDRDLDLVLDLHATGDAVLIEESKTDAFWGVGKKGDGKNMLGVLLMELRETIRRGRPETTKAPTPADRGVRASRGSGLAGLRRAGARSGRAGRPGT